MGSKRSVKPSKKKFLDGNVKKNYVESAKSQQSRMSWKLKYELINSDQFVNGMEEGRGSSGDEEQSSPDKQPPVEEKKTEVKKKEAKQKTTVIAGLSGYLSTSDSDSESSDQEVDINGEVKAFLKEIDEIKFDSNGNPIEPAEKKEGQKSSSVGAVLDQQQKAMRDYYLSKDYTMPTTSWQECYDSTSGYSYYWNVDTNEVRWEIPAEYQFYITTVKQQWEEYNRSLYPSMYGNASNQTLKSGSSLNQSAVRGIAGRGAIGQQTALPESSSNKDTAQSLAHAAKSTTPRNAKRRPSHNSDSEDEKIELITSYGPNSDDQSSEDDEDTRKTRKKRKHSADSKEKDSSSYSDKAGLSVEQCRPSPEITAEELERQEELKRRLACRQEDVKKLLAIKKEEAMKSKKCQKVLPKEDPSKKKPATEGAEGVSSVATAPNEEQQEVSPAIYKPDLPTDTDVPSPGEVELVEKLKSQAEILKKLGGELPEGVSRIISDTSKSDKNETCLVAGYGDDLDSESEEKDSTETDKDSTESKMKSDLSDDSSSKCNSVKEDKLKTDVRQVAAAGERVSKKVLKLSAKTKQLIDASETTKRARQTDFVNTPLGLRPANSADIDLSGAQEAEETVETENAAKRTGLGYSSETDDKPKPNKTVQFVSGGTTKDSGEAVESGTEVDIEDRRELLMGKMKFLSEGKEAPSPVQIWAEQLEILYKAWESKCLKGEFLSRWLQTIGERLNQLESTAAPPGWLCFWSREERRYCYKRVETGEVVWDFPVTTLEGTASAEVPVSVSSTAQAVSPQPQAVSGDEEAVPMDLGEGQGEIEMDLCLTPPPPSTPPSPPPAPVISTAPSPPPPPIISFPSENSNSMPPLPEETPPPLPEEAPPPLPEDAPPLPLDEAPPLPPGEPLPPGVEPPQPEITYTPPLPATPFNPPAPVPPPEPQPPITQSHRTIIHPPQDYSHIVVTPTSYTHLAYHQMHYGGPHSQYSSAFVSAAPMPAQVPAKPVEPENKVTNLSSELDSFYSDLATLEPEEVEDPNTAVTEEPAVVSQDSPEVPPPPSSSPDPTVLKKRKKSKLVPGLALKKKGVPSLVAKWQKVQQSARRDF